MSSGGDRLLALDLDGTLLRDDGTIDPRDAAAIRRARACGCAVTLATGRVTAAALPFARALELEVPLVCADGRILAHARTGATIALFAVPSRRSALAVLREHALAPMHVTPHAILHEPAVAEHLGWVASEWERIECTDDLALASDDDAVFVLGLGAPDAATTACSALGERFGDAVDLGVFPLGRGPHAVRVRAPGHDKATALARLAAQLGIARERVATVGDWYNDIGMLRWAKQSFAMAGAPAEVCDAAVAVLDARAGRGRGVAEAIERWLDG